MQLGLSQWHRPRPLHCTCWDFSSQAKAGCKPNFQGFGRANNRHECWPLLRVLTALECSGASARDFECRSKAQGVLDRELQ
jgi:hypothetical protein